VTSSYAEKLLAANLRDSTEKLSSNVASASRGRCECSAQAPSEGNTGHERKKKLEAGKKLLESLLALSRSKGGKKGGVEVDRSVNGCNDNH